MRSRSLYLWPDSPVRLIGGSMYGHGGGVVAVGGGTVVATTGGNIGLLVVIGIALVVGGLAMLRLALLHR